MVDTRTESVSQYILLVEGAKCKLRHLNCVAKRVVKAAAMCCYPMLRIE